MALVMALCWRKPVEELLRYSKRGSQYISQAYQAVFARIHIQVSMSKKGGGSR
jgi:transposase InsO family protein